MADLLPTNVDIISMTTNRDASRPVHLTLI